MSALVVELDPEGMTLFANETVSAVTGYTAGALLGRNAFNLFFPDAARSQLDAAALILSRGGDLHDYVTRCRTKDGSLLVLEWNTANQYDVNGRLQKIIAFGMNVTGREESAARILRLSRLYAAISETNAALVRSRNPDDLFTAVCRACVEHGGFKLAWVGLADHTVQRINVAKAFGPATDYLNGISLSIDADAPSGRSATATSYREQRVYICNDFATDPATAPWRERAARHGLASSITLPFRRGGKVIGALIAYGGEKNVFDREAVALLEKMTENISFAMDQYEREEEREHHAAAIRLAETRLNQAQVVANIGDWSFDLETRRMSWSPQMFRLFERDPAQGPAGPAEMLGYCFAECAEPAQDCLDRWIGASDRREVEQRVWRRDGRIAYHFYTIMQARDPGGRVTRLYGTVQDITEQRELELERTADALRMAELSRRVVRVQEEERRRLARELHDRTSPNLTAVALNLGLIAAEMASKSAAALESRVADTHALLEDTIAGIREISADLHSSILDHAGLLAALQGYAEQFTRRTAIAVKVSGPAFEPRLAADKESALFRIAQEALTNCVKHARADSIRITLTNEAGHAVLTIADDGAGFDSDTLRRGDHAHGLGLITMRERAEFAGGGFSLESAPGKGTRIRVEI